jgi:hypothetical protein
MWQAREPVMLAQSWHTSPDERYDFGAGDQRIEVKSASHRRRVHDFALEQIRPPAGVRVVVASIFVESSVAGMSLRELSENVRERIAGDLELALRFDRVLGVSLGNAWRQASDSRFDLALAEESLRFFAAEKIPSVMLPIPPEVTDIRFRSDVSQARCLEPSALAGEGGIFRAIVGDPAARVGRRR